MELISTHVVKTSEIGICNNMFGGNIMALIDGSAAAYAMQVCNSKQIVTLEVDNFLFKKPIKVGDILKIYGNVIKFGRTSITVMINVRRYSVEASNDNEIVTTTFIKFVHVDEEGNSTPIPDAVKVAYYEKDLVKSKFA